MEKEKRKVKIRTKKGMILTLDISKKTEEVIFGTDKFGEEVIISLDDIATMMPLGEKDE